MRYAIISSHFTILETWRDARSDEMHLGADDTIAFRRNLLPFMGSPYDARENHPLR